MELRIKQYRERRGWTQAELAERAGLPQSSIASYELGKSEPRVSAVLMIAEALGVRFSDLVDLDGYQKPKTHVLSDEELELVGLYRKCDARARSMAVALLRDQAGHEA